MNICSLLGPLYTISRLLLWREMIAAPLVLGQTRARGRTWSPGPRHRGRRHVHSGTRRELPGRFGQRGAGAASFSLASRVKLPARPGSIQAHGAMAPRRPSAPCHGRQAGSRRAVLPPLPPRACARDFGAASYAGYSVKVGHAPDALSPCASATFGESEVPAGS